MCLKVRSHPGTLEIHGQAHQVTAEYPRLLALASPGRASSDSPQAPHSLGGKVPPLHGCPGKKCSPGVSASCSSTLLVAHRGGLTRRGSFSRAAPRRYAGEVSNSCSRAITLALQRRRPLLHRLGGRQLPLLLAVRVAASEKFQQPRLGVGCFRLPRLTLSVDLAIPAIQLKIRVGAWV